MAPHRSPYPRPGFRSRSGPPSLPGLLPGLHSSSDDPDAVPPCDSGCMESVAALVGIVIIVVIIWEVFKDLFHPAHSGAFSDWLGRRLFNLVRGRPSMLPIAGPLAVVGVIGSWVLMLVLGFGLIYNSSFPEGFRTSTGEIPPDSPQLLSALYFSFATLVTLGYGDLVPNTMPMRFIATTEALIGFGLLTASVSSIVLLYPALSRMRLAARRTAHLVAAQRATGVSVIDSASVPVLERLADDVTSLRIDLVHFPIAYYFAADEADASVARWAMELVRIATAGLSADGEQIRLAAGLLDSALTDLARHLGERFVRVDPGDREAVFRAVARDHAVSLA